MIFADSEIDVWGVLGGIDPFDEECVNPASIDLRWSGSYKIANKPRLIDILVRKLSNNKPTSRTFWSKETHCEWLTMEPGRFLSYGYARVCTYARRLCWKTVLEIQRRKNGYRTPTRWLHRSRFFGDHYYGIRN